ncbi:PREDICTED: LOW QUALITY PROTEIN: interferon, epsilon [Elephantulus edwardii]|uniref:LOW QUALITY PROTEIN: interferon, epsilon n=1 Tax=Elephantulus edwardii TaxID=28737 RepID=UPI0003F08B55|nr:PREDICTED: LOW QUALITY PROTEIN: interferon, epsilon [Elephantulus edwardii]
MIDKHFFVIALLLLASPVIFSLGLKSIHSQQRRVIRESLKFLTTLQSSWIRRCLPHRENFALPHKSMNSHQDHEGHAVAILHEMLQQIFSLFRTNHSVGNWEQSHMEKFLTELHQQLDHLEALEAEQKSHPLGTDSFMLQVKMYFRRIRRYLKNQKNSHCAWTIVRVEVIRCLFFLFRITRKLSNKNGPSNPMKRDLTTAVKSIG